jgi:hypothetical protein
LCWLIGARQCPGFALAMGELWLNVKKFPVIRKIAARKCRWYFWKGRNQERNCCVPLECGFYNGEFKALFFKDIYFFVKRFFKKQPKVRNGWLFTKIKFGSFATIFSFPALGRVHFKNFASLCNHLIFPIVKK